MKMLGLHSLNSLSEKVYTMYEFDSEEDIDYELSSFFDEIMARKRDDDIEGGLQAGGVIYPDKAAFKVSEKDGRGSHAQAQEHSSQFINGETSFTGDEAIGFMGGARRSDPNAWMNIPKNGFTVRVVATEDMMIFIFNTYSYRISDFQLDVVHNLVTHIKEAYQNNDIKYPYINFVTNSDRFIFDENKDIDEQLDTLEDIILDKKEPIKKASVR